MLDFAETSYPDNLHGFVSIKHFQGNPQVLFAGARIAGETMNQDRFTTSYGIFKSSDGGESWTAKNNGLHGMDKNINQIAIHPTSQDTVYAATLNSGIYKTSDGGNNWITINNNLPNLDIRTIAIDPETPNTVYAGIEHGGVVKSMDGGLTWQAKNIGMDPEAVIRAVAIDPANPVTVYAADWSTGVYKSIDGGESWQHINDGLRTRAVNAMAISADGKTIYAGTEGEGVFRLVSDQMAPSVQSVDPDTTQVVTLIQGDSLMFQVTALDANNDILQYNWFLDGTLLKGATLPGFLFKSDSLAAGNYELSVVIADSFSSVTTVWQIQVTPASSVATNDSGVPDRFQVFQNYPNPFNPSTTIKFAVKRSTRVELKIYDILGRLVKTLVDEPYPAGYHNIVFNAGNLASGLYFYEIRMADFSDVRKALLLK